MSAKNGITIICSHMVAKLNPRLPEAFFVTCLPKGVVTTLSLDFRYNAPPILMILVLEDRYESPVSIDTKKVPVVFRLTSQWRFNDALVRKKRILQIFAENMLIFKFSPKILKI